jgi:hypothetical protein
MKKLSCCCLLIAMLVGINESLDAVQSAAKEKKAKPKVAAKPKGEPAVLDPFNRPEGEIVEQQGRFYVWYDDTGDDAGWHLRTAAKVGRKFSGTIRLKDAKIKACLPVGLKDKGQKKTATDAWQFNEARDELKFQFLTGKFSDGFRLIVDGEEGEIEFDLTIDMAQKNPKNIFVGKGEQHPSENPFRLPAKPKKATAEKATSEKSG